MPAEVLGECAGMTTNAIDRVRNLIASDSRWSTEVPGTELLIYVDDTGFDKIANRTLGSIICAGDGVLIDEWRKWFLNPVLNWTAFPRTERQNGPKLESITISYVQCPDGKVYTYNGWYALFGNEAMFAGTGAEYAKDCFARNRCPIQAIATAAATDPFTGGKTLQVDVATNRHNLNAPLRTVAHAEQELNQRGIAMNMRTGKRCTLAELRADPSLAQALSANNLSLSAPTGQAPRAWTQAERDDFKKVLEEAARREAGLMTNASNDK